MEEFIWVYVDKFFTLVYNESTRGIGFVSPCNINFPKEWIITSTFV